MKDIQNVVVIGAGGIGRSLAFLLNDYSRRGLDYFTKLRLSWFDDDEVEPENVWTQGFTKMAADSCQLKVRALMMEFRSLKILPKEERLVSVDQFAEADAVLIACDNLETRKLVYENCFKHGIYFVDGRVNGLNYFVADSTCDRATLNESLIPGQEAGPTSCLMKHHKENKLLFTTPVMVASTMIQFLLNFTRGEENSIVEGSM